jgi:PAS domain S-box-containing protein
VAELPENDGALRIRAVLKDCPHGMSIKEIAAAVGMSRNSVAKYLEVLAATGHLDVRHVGNAKLYTLSGRVSVDHVITWVKELIIVIDENMEIVQASDALCTFNNAPREAILHARLSSLPIPFLTVQEENEMAVLLRGNASWKRQIRVRQNGVETVFESRFIPTVLENGRPGVTIILENTDEHRLAEDAMRERDRLLHIIFQIPATPRFFIDRNHKVVYWDRALEILTGFTSEEMVGTSQHWRAFYAEARPCLADLILDGDIERAAEHYHGPISQVTTIDGGYESTDFFPRLGHEGRWLHIMASVHRDSAGHLTGAMETIEDVTDKKKREFAAGPSRPGP